ncbi:5-methylcytosine rRNA methyltransferase NSUN4 [Periophthalmus magnuspinnatus]|uniref:5-methylcytosine rRNA methyltransferase NSUN4 n=1 Tax=Periophthalmus magnuspinnatus TaxID=409849 RepID=UPI00145AB6E1|nr:5-methylcytosine rRNA methyltransferase NSUN4 [Periophthalmus magnuspinnatus]
MALLMETKLILRKVKDLRCFTAKRNRVKEKWAATRPKYPPTRLALQHMDAVYGAQLGSLWPSVRVALLCERKYGALVNTHSHHDVISELQHHGCADFITSTALQESQSESVQVEGESQSDLRTTSDVSPGLNANIKCFVFPQGDISRFKPARPDANGLLGYYLMDAASVLPCLALDVREGHTVLDLCAAPGGKALAFMQTHGLGFVCLNDSSVSRTMRLRRVLHSYIPKALLSDHRLRISSFDGTMWGQIERGTFDRVLVDVPCTTDRHSVTEEDNNIFSKSRVGERRRLPQLQTELLLAGLEAVCPGGEVLYSTCTLSQQQNQAVVEQAEQLALERHGIQIQVVSLKPLTRNFTNTFHFAPELSVGELVLPHLAANFGPIYMCKLKRLT